MKNRIIKFLLLFAFSIIYISCNDFLDVNDDPNNPTKSEPSLTLPVAQQDLLALQARTTNYVGNYLVYNWATPSNWSANRNILTYNFTANTLDNLWETSYASIFKNLTYIENAEGTSDYSAYKVISKILKSYQYQYLVDLYGDVPYSEANLRAEVLTPKYDKAEEIYKSLIKNLTDAANKAVNMPEKYETPGKQDIIFNGDMKKWAQFANTVKLRLLIRISGTGQDSYIKDEMVKINSNEAGFIEQDVFGDPGYSDNDQKQNPFFGYIGQEPGAKKGVYNDRNDQTVASDYVINYLESVTKDPRLTRIYSEAKVGGYHGVEQSTDLPGEGFTSKDLSHVGPGLIVNSTQKQPLMLLSEALLLQAEAMVEGLIPGGEAGAKSKYEEAIESSFEFLKVPAEKTASDYYSQAIPNVSWDSSTNKIQAIAIQKWIVLNGVNGMESWIEHTRTGFPSNLPLPKNALGNGKRPVRLLYPASEIARNSKNVPVQTKNDVFTNIPFWKK